MKLLSSLAGGFAGAVTVTLLHQLVQKKYAGTPRPDLPAAHEVMGATPYSRPKAALQARKPVRMAGEVLASTLYFSLAGARMKNLFSIGSLQGLLAGVGAVSLPRKYQYNGSPAAGKAHKWVTIGLYLAGGLVSAMVIRWLEKRDQPQLVSPYNPPTESYKPVIDITV